MTTQVVWRPNIETLENVYGMLEKLIDPTYTHFDMMPYINTYGGLDDLNFYLLLIFARCEGKPVVIRKLAGYLLKTNLNTNAYKLLKPIEEQFIKDELLPCLGSNDPDIRNAVGSIISVVLKKCGFHGWPNLFPTFLESLIQADFNYHEGALNLLYKICQVCKSELFSKVPMLSEAPIVYIAPRIYQFLGSQHESLRKLSLQILIELQLEIPETSRVPQKIYMETLLLLANDPSPDVRKLADQVFLSMMEEEFSAMIKLSDPETGTSKDEK